MPHLDQKLPMRCRIPSRLWAWVGILALLWLGLASPVAARIHPYQENWV